MKKPAFEIAIASVVLSTNVVAQQPVVVPTQITPMNNVVNSNGAGTISIINPGGAVQIQNAPNLNGTISGMSGGVIQMQNASNLNGTIAGMSGGSNPVLIGNQSGVISNTNGTIVGTGGSNIQLQTGTNNSMGTMQYLPGINAAQLQAQKAVLVGTVITPMGAAQAYRYKNRTFFVLSDGKVYTSN